MVPETAPDDIGISVAYPLPGTKFHQNVLTQLGPRPNWSDSGDLAMVFQGAYSSEFYRALADALHIEVRRGRNLHAAWARVHSLKRSESDSAPVEAVA